MSQKMHKTILLVSIALFLILCPFILTSIAIGQDEYYSRETLAGIKGVCPILIGNLPDDSEKSVEMILADMESKLRMAGIDVLSQAESLKSPGQPTLEVMIKFVPLPQQGEYIVYITTAFYQNVFLERNKNIGISSTTWFTDILAFKPKGNELYDIIKVQMDRFITAYLSVNNVPHNKSIKKSMSGAQSL